MGVLVALGVGVPSAESSPPSPIVGGEEASPGEYPAQGYLEVDFGGGDNWFCGGTLVAPRSFLTAAHCATEFFSSDPIPPDTAAVTLGEVDLNQTGPEDVYGVDTVEVHEDYGDPIAGSNDMALLTLDRAAPFAPLPLVDPDEPELWDAGTPASIIGWGTTSYNGELSDALLEAEVPMTSDAQCDAAYGAEFDATTMVCAGDGVHDTCQGDSGGPLMVPDNSGELVLAGITSWGYGCADPEFPGVYTRIGAPALNAWVLTRISAAPPPNPPPPVEPPPPPVEPPPAPPPPLLPPPVEPPPLQAPTAPKVLRCVVPRLRGKTLLAARRALARANCRLGSVTRAYSASVAARRVIRHRPAAGTRLGRLARVNVVLSRGKRKR